MEFDSISIKKETKTELIKLKSSFETEVGKSITWDDFFLMVTKNKKKLSNEDLEAFM
jgi:hypothetical protein